MVQTQQKTECSFTPTVTSNSIARVYTWRNRVPQRALERLELLDAKVSRAVLRGRDSGTTILLPDTDVKDAEWIADLLQHGLLKASFIPPQNQRDLRDLTRYRTTLIQERARLANRLYKLLEEANLKLSTVISDVLGTTGRLILHAVTRGETDPEKLADLALARLPQKRAAIAQALCGRFREHHRFLLQELLDAIEYHDRAIAR